MWGERDLLAKAKAKVINLGANLIPFEAWLGCRGLKTMSVRMERHIRNAAFLANQLRKVSKELRIYITQNMWLKEVSGAMVSIELDEKADVKTFFKSLGWVKILPYFSWVNATVSYPIATSHRTIPEDTRQKLGINKQVVRISVGIENEHDI